MDTIPGAMPIQGFGPKAAPLGDKRRGRARASARIRKLAQRRNRTSAGIALHGRDTRTMFTMAVMGLPPLTAKAADVL